MSLISLHCIVSFVNFVSPLNAPDFIFPTTDYILVTNLMHWLFIHKILNSSTRFEPQVLIFRRIQTYIYSIWYCHSLR